MAKLVVTMMDVGWGDSILVEAVPDGDGESQYGLIDCNDYSRQRVSMAFVKRYFERRNRQWKERHHNFEWVLLTHGHADHARGLKQMMATFGTRHFWYPKSVASTTYGTLLTFANRSSRVLYHQAVDRTKKFEAPGVVFAADIKVLWPDYNVIDTANENNNSVVLSLGVEEQHIVLTGDSEAENWPLIVDRLPVNTDFFQVPHHGARNGVFDGETTPWVDHFLRPETQVKPSIIISSHVVPHGHPHPDVISRLDIKKYTTYRTDRHYELTVEIDGTSGARIRYSH